MQNIKKEWNKAIEAGHSLVNTINEITKLANQIREIQENVLYCRECGKVIPYPNVMCSCGWAI